MSMVPVVVLTGFLGAGKTTLINRLLARGRMGKVGVIVNELGAVGIDGALLGGAGARQVELPGGCVCCEIGDELETTAGRARGRATRAARDRARDHRRRRADPDRVGSRAAAGVASARGSPRW